MSSSIIRDSFRISNLKKFISSLSGSDSLYLGIGRPQYWDVSTIPNNDAVELTNSLFSAKNTIMSDIKDREDMMSLKRVNSTDVSHGISKVVWAAGNKYDIYRHDWDGTIQCAYDGTYPSSLADVKYVVINTQYDIYICLRQGKTGSTINPSTYSPETGTVVGIASAGVRKTADGYYWKFIGKTDTADFSAFASITHHPIRTLTVAPLESSAYYTQWTSQVNSQLYKSGIYVIQVTNGGSGYNSGLAGTRTVTDAEGDTEFKVIGDGTGLQYTVTYGTGGSIVDIDVINPGTGYTHATISATGGLGATFDVIYTTPWGLGADPVKDTSAVFLLVSVSLQSDEGGKFTVLNDFRKVSLISNPCNYGTAVISTGATLSAYSTLNVGSIVGGATAFKSDDIITGATSGAKARVIDFDGIGVIRIIRTSSENLASTGANNPFLTGETITTSGGVGTATISSIDFPEVDTKAGDVIYSEYRGAVLRQSGQTEQIKIVTQF